ncbi:MAG: pentapeptide repeat-containing protein [Labedaea sp.]
MESTAFLVLGIVGIACGAGVFVVWLVRPRTGLPLAGTVLLAFGVLAVVTGWLLAGGGINRGESLKTGGLAAGSVVALYALWLNDRRSRVEEQRQEIERRRQELETERYALEQRRQDLEHQRAEHDRERVADERFARAVELLGSAADQVQVGAMHALVGLARSRPAYTQTVLDVLCAYLRRPFDHPRYAATATRGAPEPDDDLPRERERRELADRTLQVRATAQRLIADLLPPITEPDPPHYDLDLHGATLEYFDISDRVVGQIRARTATFYEATNLRGTRITKDAWFTRARCWGRFYAEGAVFEARCWFSGFAAEGTVSYAGVEFHGETKFARSRFAGPVSFLDARFAGAVDLADTVFSNGLDLRVAGGATARTHAMRVSLEHDVLLPDGWKLDRSHGPKLGLVRA